MLQLRPSGEAVLLWLQLPGSRKHFLAERAEPAQPTSRDRSRQLPSMIFSAFAVLLHVLPPCSRLQVNQGGRRMGWGICYVHPVKTRDSENWKPRILNLNEQLSFPHLTPLTTSCQVTLSMSTSGTRESWDAGGLAFSQPSIGAGDAEVSRGSVKKRLRPIV